MPPPPPPMPPHESHKHEHPHEHPLPPHERKKKFFGRRLVFSILIGSALTVAVSAALWLLGVNINVILPVAAPILVGSVSLSYTALGDRLI